MNKEDLRIVLMGTSDFGCPTLDMLVNNGFNVVGVVTKPDFYNQRKKRLEPTPIKEKAMELGIPVLETKEDMNSKDFQAKLGAFSGNIFIVIAFQMVPPGVYSMAKYGAFNIHASSLPDYRGAAPINWAIANGESRIGITSFYLNEKIDDGKIICQTSIPNYSHRNFTQIYEILKQAVCGGLCCETLRVIMEADGYPKTYDQDLSKFVHKAPKLTRENTKLDLTKDIHEINNFIKAFSEKPGAWCIINSEDKFNERTIKLLGGEVVSFGHKRAFDGDNAYFRIIDGELFLFAYNGCIKITKLQLEGCKVMEIKDFINGYGNFIENWILV